MNYDKHNKPHPSSLNRATRRRHQKELHAIGVVPIRAKHERRYGNNWHRITSPAVVAYLSDENKFRPVDEKNYPNA